MPVIVKKVLDGSKTDIENRKFNIFVPISLGNLYFTRERVREMVQWAIQHTKERVVILIADKIQAINYEVLRDMDQEQSLKAAHDLGDNFYRMAERVVRSLPADQQEVVSVARWEDIEESEFTEMQTVLKEEYQSNPNFKAEVHRVVTQMLADKLPDGESDLHRLGDYVIEEMPLMFKGITVNGTHYDVFLYPGLSELDILVSDIQSRRRFSEIADRLGLTTKQPFIEVYVKEGLGDGQ